ncbi:NAD(P)H-hydrate dehydratase [Sabulicella glaciei]|uniref:ADP-dependent (S)-NAD(P)H-hydrate dehydratase n=1 Tax=Sabulicella glaciei TaxID=2984948 RepID=A0ABT3NTM5_9PROT|nr:NAD(P)H-hydrate dehydratase [Roseococcus sp. MDT2-1-1]MCW8085513.1 NAD(P)H-hydrate dehydratase [Roseococcus sp. MDT2-1-1]
MSVTEISPEWLRANPLPPLPDAASKDERGRVLVVGGAAEVPGAVLLAATSALRAGAGKMQVATVASAAPGLALAMPEARVIALKETAEGGIAPAAAPRLSEAAARADAIAFGPGMLDAEEAGALARALLTKLRGEPGILLDAAAVCGLEPDSAGRHAGRLVLTPHAGEMAQLLDRPREELEAEPLEAAREAARRFRAVVVMKGGVSFVATPQGLAFSCARGNVGLATSGSGDTLAGAITGLMARGAPPLLATLWGVFIHAVAGERLARRIGPVGYLARELPGEFPGILAEMDGG